MKLKKVLWIVAIIVLVAVVGVGIFTSVVSYKMGQIPSMSFEEMLAYTTKDNKDAIITVGIIKGEETLFTVYGNNASVLPSEKHVYEIGSLTKTFTSSLLCKAIAEGKVDLDDQINKYIDLPIKEYYPTIKRLVTHTSGYKGYYLNKQMMSNTIRNEKNDFYGVNKDNVIEKIGKINLINKDYEFEYSNFGMSVVGMVLSNIYDIEYTKLINDFISEDLTLENTKISDGTGDLNKYWRWQSDDAYLPAGGLTSNISDIMQYVKLQMSHNIPYLSYGHEVMAEINANTKQNIKMNIRMDKAGIGWMIDRENNVIWHNGGTTNFNSYVAFDKDKQIGVVILSNCAPKYRIPATVMGIKLMTTLQNKDSI